MWCRYLVKRKKYCLSWDVTDSRCLGRTHHECGYEAAELILIIYNNNNNNNNHDNIYSAVIVAEPLREFTRFTRWIQKWRQVAADLWTKPIGLSCRPSYRQPVNHIHHRQLVLLLSPIADTHESTLVAVTYRDGLPALRRSPIQVPTGSDVE